VPAAELKKKADRAALVGILGNLLLTAFKLVAGILSGSMAVIGDSLHSLSDSLGSLLVYLGIRKARQPPDPEHPFGHGDIEAITGLFIAISLALIAYEFGRRSLVMILQGESQQIGYLAIVAAVVSVVLKESMARYTFGVAKETHSLALDASAWDQRSDALSSLVVLAGVSAAVLGYQILDSVFAVGMAVLIGVVGVRIGKKNIENLVGTLPDPEMAGRIEGLVLSFSAVRTVHKIRLHYFGSYAEVDMHVIMDPTMTIEMSHDVTDGIIERVKANIPEIAFVNVHVEPK
jgi:cation diffusion facilitator family transporter